MENSFFEYRNKTDMVNSDEDDSETEVIDNSMDSDESFKMLKRTPFKTPINNRTVFIAESDESTEDGESEDNTRGKSKAKKSTIRRSSVAEAHTASSSDDGRQGRRQTKISDSVVISSSDEEELSPELIPRRRPPITPQRNGFVDSPVNRRKVHKRMIFVESDADNSIVLAHDKNKKMTCLKDTPLKLDLHTDKHEPDESMVNSDVDSSDENDLNKIETKKSLSDSDDAESSSHENDIDDDDGPDKDQTKKSLSGTDDAESSSHENDIDDDDGPDEEQTKKSVSGSDNAESSSHENDTDDDDGPDEDQMVMSRATRMSIMGIIPKDNESDESDFIESDASNLKSREGSLNSAESLSSYTELPDVGISIKKTPEKITVPIADDDTSRISCSPFSSPLHNITNELNESKVNPEAKNKNTSIHGPKDNETKSLNNKVLKNLLLEDIITEQNKENVKDDDITIIDDEPEIIALSSDDDEIQAPKKSPKPRKSPKSKNEGELSTSNKNNTKGNDMKQYLPPASYPNGRVVYVRRDVREKELNKLNSLRADLHNVRYLLENMDVTTLPDNGAKLIERLAGLEEEVRKQGDKVANMIVDEGEPPTVEQIAGDNYNGKVKAEPSWEDIQKASNAVQPRMFGKQALSTHMAERNLILERLKDLHQSLASRPSETQVAKQPSYIKSTLMPHQLHALAWLKWRETQRPSGGILADDMGLGKTITMIALVAADRENRMDNDDDDDSDDEARPSSKLARGGTLVVCPASLIQQWGGEVSRHCNGGALSVCLHHGSARATHPHRLTTNDIVVTTYNILQRDKEKKGVLMRVQWRRVILDEAHIVRNHKSATSAGVCALAARRRWCLTGTPVHNKDLDLFALLKFLRCTPFDELAMWKKWIDNKTQGGQERLNTIMQCILLRRTKLQLQQRGQLTSLPERTAHHRMVTLSKNEWSVYQRVLVFSKTLFAQFLHQRADKLTDSAPLALAKNSYYDEMRQKMTAMGVKSVRSHEILVLLLRLRQVCCHCGLIASMLGDDEQGLEEEPGTKDLLDELEKLSLDDLKNKTESKNKDDNDDEEQKEEVASVAEAIRSVLSPGNPVFNLKNVSSKIQSVMECLNENVFSNKDDKAVVVSQWTSVLQLVDQELKKAGVRSVTLNGQVPALARPALVDALNNPHSDVKVMLLSLAAGGVGLNLKGANHLLLLDPHWNPQLEEQAQDRIYRIGQTKPVHIYRFMCENTVEQTIRKLQEAKLALAENVLTGARNTNNSHLTIEDLKMLFNMGAPTE